MREGTFRTKKAGTSTFSNSSLVSPHTPTLANPVHGFGFPTNNVIQAQTSESTNQQPAQSAAEESLLSQAIQQRSFGHDISRIALRRPQAKLTVGQPEDQYSLEADRVANQVMSMPVPTVQRQMASQEQTENEVQTKSLAATITPLVQREVMPNVLLQLKHLSIAETIANFRDLVTPKNEKRNSPTLVKTGQFYWTQQISFAILEYLKTLKPINGNEIWQKLIVWIESVVNEWPHNRATSGSQQIQLYLTQIHNLASHPDYAAVIPLLSYIKPLLKSSSQQGKEIYYQLWGQLKQTDQVPNLDQYRSLPALQAIWEWENQACGYTGNQATSRYTQKGGAKKVNPDAKRRQSTAVWARFAGSGIRDMRKLPNKFRQGDALIQNGVGAMIPKMQAALDDGWVLHARVLSGIDYGWGEYVKAFDEQQAKGKPPVQPQRLGNPPEEHSIMLIGYDGNEFVFTGPRFNF